MTVETASIDKIDREILSVLAQDARIPWSSLGDRVHLSANAVADRVRRLVRQGVITRFTIDVDQAALGRDLEAVVDVLTEVEPHQFAEQALQRDEITRMSYITGRVDFRMHVSCAGTKGLDDLLAYLKDAGARETNTTVVLRRLR